MRVDKNTALFVISFVMLLLGVSTVLIVEYNVCGTTIIYNAVLVIGILTVIFYYITLPEDFVFLIFSYIYIISVIVSILIESGFFICGE